MTYNALELQHLNTRLQAYMRASAGRAEIHERPADS
jgi:hypothetical protein